MNNKEDQFQYRFDLLKQEIDALESGIRNYDTIMPIIMGWAVTVFATLTFFAIDKHRAIVLLVAIPTLMLFWFINAVYRSLQRVLINRHEELEKFLRGQKFDEAVDRRSFGTFLVPNLRASFATKSIIKQLIDIWDEMKYLHNFILYMAMIIISIILGILIELQVI